MEDTNYVVHTIRYGIFTDEARLFLRILHLGLCLIIRNMAAFLQSLRPCAVKCHSAAAPC